MSISKLNLVILQRLFADFFGKKLVHDGVEAFLWVLLTNTQLIDEFRVNQVGSLGQELERVYGRADITASFVAQGYHTVNIRSYIGKTAYLLH